MTSNRAYLVRALHEWILDNNMTPHILVDATVDGALVPQEFVNDGRIVLNVAPQAVRDLFLGNDVVQFHARFGGRSVEVRVPIAAVMGIYARESGKGMIFPEEEGGQDSSSPPPARQGGKPSLKVVK